MTYVGICVHFFYNWRDFSCAIFSTSKQKQTVSFHWHTLCGWNSQTLRVEARFFTKGTDTTHENKTFFVGFFRVIDKKRREILILPSEKLFSFFDKKPHYYYTFAQQYNEQEYKRARKLLTEKYSF